jgi:hypothetical protein
MTSELIPPRKPRFIKKSSTVPETLEVSSAALQKIRDGIHSGYLKSPLARDSLAAFGIRNQLDALVSVLAGHSKDACISILETALSERLAAQKPAPELVWTGIEGKQGTARDTAVVLKELFESARERVVLAGYSFLNANAVLQPLHDVMTGHAVEAHFFVDIAQPQKSDSVSPEEWGNAQLSSFIQVNWPFGPPYPSLYCDRRALHPGPPWVSLHSKCVTVDGKRAFISSANFTTRGQERNIETGVLLHDAAFAEQLERKWMSLVGDGLVFSNCDCGHRHNNVLKGELYE